MPTPEHRPRSEPAAPSSHPLYLCEQERHHIITRHEVAPEPRMGRRRTQGSCVFTIKSHFLGGSGKPSASRTGVLPKNQSLTPHWPGKLEEMCEATEASTGGTSGQCRAARCMSPSLSRPKLYTALGENRPFPSSPLFLASLTICLKLFSICRRGAQQNGVEMSAKRSHFILVLHSNFYLFCTRIWGCSCELPASG